MLWVRVSLRSETITPESLVTSRHPRAPPRHGFSPGLAEFGRVRRGGLLQSVRRGHRPRRHGHRCRHERRIRDDDRDDVLGGIDLGYPWCSAAWSPSTPRSPLGLRWGRRFVARTCGLRRTRPLARVRRSDRAQTVLAVPRFPAPARFGGPRGFGGCCGTARARTTSLARGRDVARPCLGLPGPALLRTIDACSRVPPRIGRVRRDLLDLRRAVPTLARATCRAPIRHLRHLDVRPRATPGRVRSRPHVRPRQSAPGVLEVTTYIATVRSGRLAVDAVPRSAAEAAAGAGERNARLAWLRRTRHVPRRGLLCSGGRRATLGR